MDDVVLVVLGAVSAVVAPLAVGWLADRPAHSAASQRQWHRMVNVYDLAWLAGGLRLAKRAAAVELCARGVVHADHDEARLDIDLPLPRDAHSVERTVYGDLQRRARSADADQRAIERIERSLLEIGLLARATSSAGPTLLGVVVTLLPLILVAITLSIGDMRSVLHAAALITSCAAVFGGAAALIAGARLRTRRTVEGDRFLQEVRAEHPVEALARSRIDDVVHVGTLSVSPATLSVALYGRNVVLGVDPSVKRGVLSVDIAEAERARSPLAGAHGGSPLISR